MSLAPGRRLGPYEIVSSLGTGGMGEVYRARDTRLGRDVALKILPLEHAGDADRLRRFEREARAVAALDHPHILALHDVGSEDGLSYAVFELVPGQTLRQNLEQGPLPVRKVVEYAVQICRGLAAAHAQGIVHRDLKPDNLCFTLDGRVKILDFGLAKLTEPAHAAEPDVGETRTATEPGIAMGTPGYMSPEQVRGRPADARSDLFSLGVILYEMLSGRPAFDAATTADRLSAILHRDPPEITSGVGPVPQPLAQIVRRCLEKAPDDRFQTARDLAFALESLSGTPPSGTRPAPDLPRGRWLPIAVGALVVAALAVGAFLWGPPRPAPLPVFKQLTFRRGMILDARFTADGTTVAYSALFDGNAAETYSLRLDRPEALRLDLPPARLFGLSSSGELALMLAKPGNRNLSWIGTLARAPLSGGTPREIQDDVWAADWSPDGHDLAAIRRVDGEFQLEYPIGRVLSRPVAFAIAGFAMRVSPRGDKVAFTTPDGVIVLDRAGTPVPLKAEAFTAEAFPAGLAWDPSGDALWVASNRNGQSTGLWRIGLDGKAREAARLPGAVMIHDMSRDGRLLVHLGFERDGVRVKAPGEALERDVCPLSLCDMIHLSADGSQILLRDWSYPGGESVFTRPTRGGPPVRLGEGVPLGFSPDGRAALVVRSELKKQVLELVPTGSGTPKIVSTEGLEGLGPAWVMDDTHVLIHAWSDHQWRTYRIDLAGGKPTPVMPKGIVPIPGSLAGGSVLGIANDGSLAWYPLGGDAPRPISARCPPDTWLRVSGDGRYLFVGEPGVPGRIDKVDLASGQRIPWKTLLPEDAAGVVNTEGFSVTPDGSAYAYIYLRFFQDLYLIEGVR